MDETSQKIIDATMSLIRDKGYVALFAYPGGQAIDLPKDIQQAIGSDDYPENAKKPVFLIGGGVNNAHACNELAKLVD